MFRIRISSELNIVFCKKIANNFIYTPHRRQTSLKCKTMRLLHTMLRVGNLQRSITFYSEILGMTLLRQKDYPDGKFSLAFLGYGDEKKHTALELTYNWETEHYNLGDGFGHLAIEVDDVYLATEKIRAQGGKIIREPGPMNAGTTLLAFVTDPDGYEIELLEPKK